MKKKLLLFILPMLLVTVTMQAQIKVWDFGAQMLETPTYENMATEAIINAACSQGQAPGVQVSLLGTSNTSYGDGFYENDFGGGVKFVHKSVNSDRLRTTNPNITDYDDNVGGNFATVGVTGRIYVNSAGKGLERTLSLTTTVPNQEITLIMRNENMTGATINHYIEGPGGIQTFTISNSASGSTSTDIWEIHATLPTPGEYFCYDLVGKPSWYRVYYGNVNLSTIVPTNSIGRTLGVNKVSLVTADVKGIGNRVYVSNVKANSEITIYSITGALVKSFKTNSDTDFAFKSGLYIATIKTLEGQKSVKLLLN